MIRYKIFIQDCDGPDETFCIECDSSNQRSFIEVKRTGTCECVDTYYDDNSNAPCLSCANSNCKTCSDSSNNCGN